MKCDAAGAATMLMIWVVSALIDSAFEKQLGSLGGTVLVLGGIIGIWFGLNVRRQCRQGQSQP